MNITSAPNLRVEDIREELIMANTETIVAAAAKARRNAEYALQVVERVERSYDEVGRAVQEGRLDPEGAVPAYTLLCTADHKLERANWLALQANQAARFALQAEEAK